MSVPPVEDEVLARRPWMRWAGVALGLLLVGGVVWKLSSGSEWDAILTSVRSAGTTRLVALVGLPIVNLILTATTFWVLTNDDVAGSPRVGLREMLALIATATVLNFLPMKAGMVGRISYHKIWNGIPVARSVRVVVVELVISGVACAMLLGMAMAAARAGNVGSVAWLWTPLVVLVALAGVLRVRPGRGWRIGAALGLQYADMLVWGMRYVACFGVMGFSLSWAQSAALTTVAQAASLVPIGGSSLGLREWAIGLVAPALPDWAGTAATSTVSQGLSADLLNRAGELIGLVPIGVVAGVWVASRLGDGARPRGDAPKRPSDHPAAGRARAADSRAEKHR